jgi:hypothetical protein
MTRGRCLASAAIVSLALVVTQRADADEGSEASRRAGLQKFEEGLKAIAAGDHGGALAAFDASNTLLPSPNSELYMARCYTALGKTASAHAMFLLAAEHAEERLVAVGERRYVATHDTAVREAAAIAGDVPRLAILVPPGAGSVVVRKNGAIVAASAAEVATDPGHITIDVTGPRLVPFHAELDLARAESRSVDVRILLVRTAVVRFMLPLPRPSGVCARIGGVLFDESGLSGSHPVDPGTCVVDVTAPGYKPFHSAKACADRESVDVDVRLEASGALDGTDAAARAAATSGTPRWMFWTAAGASVAMLGTAAVVATDERPAGGFLALGGLFGAGAVALALTVEHGATEARPLRPLAYALGGAGLVALGVGAYFGVQARLADDAAASHCPTLSTCDGIGVVGGRDAHEQAQLSTITFVAGAALLAGAGVVYFTAPRSSSVTVAPAGGPSGAGLRVGGAW